MQGPHHQAAPRDAALTRLRFFLIGWVILYHLDLPLRVSLGLPALAPVLQHGYLGVDGFFLLSGFALWLGYGARPPWGRAGIADFLRRRFAKIWPLHALAMLALALLVGLAMAAGLTIREPERFGLRDFLLQFFLVNAWETTSRHTWNYPSWALSVEWAGYLAFPLILAGLIRLPRLAVPALPLLGFAGIAALDAQDPNIGLNYTLHLGLLRFALEFATGLAIGRLTTEGLLPRAALWPVLLALPAGLVLEWDALTVLGLAALIPLLRRPVPPAAAPARPDLLLRLGEASFGVYLCWVFIEAGLVLVLRRIDPGLEGRIGLMAAGFLASLLAGWLAWRFIEVPANRWLLGRRPPRAAAPASAVSGKA
ncbi:acyltransferase family protein [Belnapia moabensis]|uniref:acyltransferase family protein n=1 Tax=Belnapia moabensis TaxID=365533 RepID=UPI000693937B|nr:acyltransferase [Belnapia moabensis]